MRTTAIVVLTGVMAAAGSVRAAGQESAQNAGVYKELVMSTDRTVALVAPSAGDVSADYLVYLVNAGQQNEYMEQGVSDSSANTTYTIPAVSNSVGPGQTAYVTVTVRGAGGGFPYWIDYWAQIAGAPDTRKTARLTIDTVGTGVKPVAQAAPRSEGARITVLGGRGIAAVATHLAVFQPNGRVVWSWMTGDRAGCVHQLSACPALVRVW